MSFILIFDSLVYLSQLSNHWCSKKKPHQPSEPVANHYIPVHRLFISEFVCYYLLSVVIGLKSVWKRTGFILSFGQNTQEPKLGLWNLNEKIKPTGWKEDT